MSHTLRWLISFLRPAQGKPEDLKSDIHYTSQGTSSFSMHITGALAALKFFIRIGLFNTL